MTLRSRSCVIGRGVAMFSIWSAIAFASKMPTQIGSTRCPSLSRRMTIGMFVIGSTISPLMVISICIWRYNLGAQGALSNDDVSATTTTERNADSRTQSTQRRKRHLTSTWSLFTLRRPAPDAVRAGALHPDRQRTPDPGRRPRQVHHHIRAGAARELGLAPP